MRRTGPKAALAVLAAAAAAGGMLAVGADGQAGPPAGTLEFDVVVEQGPANQGANLVTRRRGPHIADLLATNGKVVSGAATTGRWDAFSVVTDRGNGKGGGDLAVVGTGLLTLGADSIALGGLRAGADPSAAVPGVVTGGTGRYAGAEGSVTIKVTEGTPKLVRFHMTVVLVP